MGSGFVSGYLKILQFVSIWILVLELVILGSYPDSALQYLTYFKNIKL